MKTFFLSSFKHFYFVQHRSNVQPSSGGWLGGSLSSPKSGPVVINLHVRCKSDDVNIVREEC